MDSNKIVQEVETLIAAGHLEEAVERLYTSFPNDNFCLEFSGRFAKINSERIRRVISLEDESIQTNKLRSDVLQYCKQLKNGAINPGDYVFENGDSQTPQTVVGTMAIEIKIDGDFDKFTVEEQEKLLNGIRQFLSIKGNINIINKRMGSIILTLELTAEQCEKLHWAIQRGEFSEYDVLDSEIKEEWEASTYIRNLHNDVSLKTKVGVFIGKPLHLDILLQGVGHWNSWRAKNVTITPNLSGANLSKGWGLFGADLSGADLSDTDLSCADLSGANLRDADLSDADLSGADLSEAYLNGAYLGSANLSGANLGGANLGEANLSKAYSSFVDLSDADLSKADLSGAFLGGANLSRANLSDADLSRADLSGADLSGADLSGVKLNLWQLETVKTLYNCKNLDDTLSTPLRQTHPHLFEPPKD